MVKITLTGVSVACAMLAANATPVNQYANPAFNAYQNQRMAAVNMNGLPHGLRRSMLRNAREAELADRGLLSDLLGGLLSGVTGIFGLGGNTSGNISGLGSGGNILGNLLSGVTNGAGSGGNALGSLLSGVTNGAGSGGNTVGNTISGVANGVGSIGSTVGNVISEVAKGVGTIGNTVGNVVNGVANGVQQATNNSQRNIKPAQDSPSVESASSE
ncbi:hypothetical protein AX774_g1661 [Zancudomyces culisetae]|uniref:Uncharacterized protein n=1 Tax=Zancudomyces culisetae TaxID=1213189 RepID=A0A1R1PV45_ZANCU|nr:hypothetical protein AX774_g1661 [Zancudomyces culisetae]|eukprot:OMH84803.1 hypothetical protein AX774_g1661 [Zancudomyces culisetae]